MEDSWKDFFESSNILDRQTEALQTLERSRIDEELQKARVIPNKLFKGLVVILSILQAGFLVPLFNEQGLSTILAHVKNGKTFLIWMLAQSFVNSVLHSKFQPHVTTGRIAIFDTEQGQHRCQLNVNKYFPDQYPISIDVFSVRHIPVLDILRLVEHYIIAYSPKVVFIDIGSDLLQNPNDLVESTTVTNALATLAEKYHMHICLSLHLARTSNEATGHIGSLLLKRSEVIIAVKKYQDYFLAKCLYSRDKPFEPFAFEIKDGIGVPMESIPSVIKQSKRKSDFSKISSDRHLQGINTVFAAKDGLSPSDFKNALHKEYASRVQPIGLLLTRELQRYYVDQQYLTKRNGLLYRTNNVAK